MKQFLPLFLFFIVSESFSQTEKILSGKVVCEDKPLANIDIVNIDSRKGVTTDSEGNFSISAKANEVLFIISKEYTDRKITVSETLFTTEFIIDLEKRPIELEDVKVTQVKNMKIKLTEGELNGLRIYKEASAPKVLGVYDGTTPGVNFMTLGRQLIDIFRSKDKKKPKKSVPLPAFTDYIRSTFADSFFVENLQLSSDEIGLFVSFCDADPKAKKIVATNDFFETMDFLMIKKEEFKKSNDSEK